MTGNQKAALVVGTFVICGIIAGVVMTFQPRPVPNVALIGAVLTQDSDPKKQMPVAGADITATVDLASSETRSDPSGYFHVQLPVPESPSQTVTLKFRHAGYHPLQITEPVTDQPYIARMTPVPAETRVEPGTPVIAISDVRVRYSVKSMTRLSVSSIAQVFEVVNTGGIPCNGHPPCSPDSKWKATIGSATFDAGERNEFQDPRVTCIAGPCPFTRIESISYTEGRRMLKVSARDWSYTTTFLVEAEINRTQISDMVRHSYPVIFGAGMNFTLPATAEGPSIEADENGAPIVFPLGPDLTLSWAACTLKTDADGSKLYHCELNPGYRIKQSREGGG